jgi:hypothetical protein
MYPDPGSGYIGLPANEAHYVDLLDTVVSSDAWTPLPRDLARWWLARARSAPEELPTTEGMCFGTARLGATGGIEIVPPVR